MRSFILFLAVLVLAGCGRTGPERDATPRIAVISAFEPELAVLRKAVVAPREETIGGVTFIAGKLAGKDVVLFLSGVSMVNAAMTTQMAVDHFPITRIVVSGIAGGVDPALDVGDVVAPDRWGQYLESVIAREAKTGFAPTPGLIAPSEQGFANFGMIFTRAVEVPRGNAPPEGRFWFDADPVMLIAARDIAASVSLQTCVADQCLRAPPKVVVGGHGVSGPAFVDNAGVREWAFATFEARVLDMETAAIAHVAYANGKPFIAFRSLSDLAGGDPGQNQWTTFVQLASDNSAAVVMAFLKALPAAAT